MSVKKQNNNKLRAVLEGTAFSIAMQAILTALYTFLISKGRVEVENAGAVMYIISSLSALTGGFVIINIIGGTKLDALISGLCTALISVLVSMAVSQSDINTYNIIYIGAVFIVGSYIGSLIKLVKSNKKIHKMHKG